jgi:hypothetical protein
VGVVEPLLRQPVGQSGQGRAVEVPVDVGEEQDVGPRGAEDLGHAFHGRVLAPQDVAQQEARPVAAEVGAPGGEADRLGQQG